jgi:hypothetical protein
MAKKKLTLLEERVKAFNESRRGQRRAKYWENVNNKNKENGEKKEENAGTI